MGFMGEHERGSCRNPLAQFRMASAVLVGGVVRRGQRSFNYHTQHVVVWALFGGTMGSFRMDVADSKYSAPTAEINSILLPGMVNLHHTGQNRI